MVIAVVGGPLGVPAGGPWDGFLGGACGVVGAGRAPGAIRVAVGRRNIRSITARGRSRDSGGYRGDTRCGRRHRQGGRHTGRRHMSTGGEGVRRALAARICARSSGGRFARRSVTETGPGPGAPGGPAECEGANPTAERPAEIADRTGAGTPPVAATATPPPKMMVPSTAPLRVRIFPRVCRLDRRPRNRRPSGRGGRPRPGPLRRAPRSTLAAGDADEVGGVLIAEGHVGGAISPVRNASAVLSSKGSGLISPLTSPSPLRRYSLPGPTRFKAAKGRPVLEYPDRPGLLPT